MSWRRRFTRALRTAVLSIALFGISATMPAQQASAICETPAAAAPSQGTQSEKTESRASPSGSTPLEAYRPRSADWNTVSHTVSATVDEVTGRTITTTIIVKEEPASTLRSPATSFPLGPQIALAANICSATSDISYAAHTTMDGVFTQHVEAFLDRYIASDPPNWVYAYRNFQTDVWWTRTSTAYSMSGHQESWNFGNFNCNTDWDPRSATSTSWMPSWGTYSTPVYHYYGPMSSWPNIYAAKIVGGGELRVGQWTDVLESGWFAGRLNGSIVFPKN